MSPLKAIKRVEENQERVLENGNPAEFVSYAMGNPDARRRVWRVDGKRIVSCEFLDKVDEVKNKMKVEKFIKGYNNA